MESTSLLCLLFLLWALVATGLCFYNPFPFNFPDRGHRVFEIKDERAREVIIKIFSMSGLKPRFTFDSGPTHQTLFMDNTTVINYLEKEKSLDLPASAISLPVSNPNQSAVNAVRILENAGYKAIVYYSIIPNLPENNLVLVSSDVFKNWVLVFRLPLYKMPKPKIRK